MKYRIGSVEYEYSETEKHGAVRTESRTYVRENAYELLNIFINEIESRLRRNIQNRLEKSGMNKYTGFPAETGESSISSDSF